METKNIMIVGVGGQGTLLASKLLGRILLENGYDVKVSEVHGMSQRGGSVTTQVRYGARVYSPFVGLGGADVLVAFEKMEAVRYANFLKPDGVAVINDFEMPSAAIAAGLWLAKQGPKVTIAGRGAVLRYRFNGKVYEKELSGGDASTTNNRMELTDFIEALRQLKEPCEVRLCSDSQYVINGLEKGWARSWQQRGWVKSDKKPALNPDLWEQLLALTDIHEVRCHWVKGHAENKKNNRCDQMAVAESRKFQ